MAAPIPFRAPIDFGGLEILNVTFQVIASDPGTPATGQFWYNSASGHAFMKTAAGTTRLDNLTAAEILTAVLTVDGTTSGLDSDLLDGQHGSYYVARANHTGTQLAATVSDFDAQTRTSRLDQMAAPSAAVSMNSQRLTNVGTPTSGGDAVTKTYADSLAAGLDPHASVRAATTANGTLATAFANGSVIDGVTLATADRVLIKDQTTQTENGIYTVNASGAPTRAADADTGAELSGGSFVFVEEGAVNADTGWVASHDGVPTIGSSNISFTQFSSSASITAGAGLTKTGNTIDIGTASAGRIVVNADTIDLASGVATPGTYTSVTVDTYGRVTGGTTPAVVTKYSATVGDGSTNPIVITNATHGRGANAQLHVIVYEVGTGDQVYANVNVNNTNGTVTVTFAVAPTTNQYRVVIMG